MRRKNNHLKTVILLMASCLFLLACTAAREGETAVVSESSPVLVESAADADEHEDEAEILTLPELTAVALNGTPLKVVATTSIIGDVVAQIGGDAIALTVLLRAGQDSHSYEPSVGDLTAVADAHIIFINGWDLEEGLLDDLENVTVDVPLVPVSANIEPLAMGEDDEHEEETEHDHKGADPHTWHDPHLVKQWVANVAQTLQLLNPDNADLYTANAAAYLAELDVLIENIEAQIATIPVEQRILVTNHDALSYFAARYQFEVIGTVIPAASTLAEPSASNLTALVEAMHDHKLCTIFTETSASEQLAQAVAAELSDCDIVKIERIYTEAIGPAGSGADSYIGMMMANVTAVVEGLR